MYSIILLIQMELPSELTIWNMNKNSSANFDTSLHQNVYCVIVVALSESNFENIENMIINIKHRRMIIVASSTQVRNGKKLN